MTYQNALKAAKANAKFFKRRYIVFASIDSTKRNGDQWTVERWDGRKESIRKADALCLPNGKTENQKQEQA